MSPETLIPQNSTNTLLVTIKDNSFVLGLGLLAIAFIIYSRKDTEHQLDLPPTPPMTEESIPTYEEATMSSDKF